MTLLIILGYFVLMFGIGGIGYCIGKVGKVTDKEMADYMTDKIVKEFKKGREDEN